MNFSQRLRNRGAGDSRHVEEIHGKGRGGGLDHIRGERDAECEGWGGAVNVEKLKVES